MKTDADGIVSASLFRVLRLGAVVRCQALVLHDDLSCRRRTASVFSSRSAAYMKYSRLMTEGSRCNRFLMAIPSRKQYFYDYCKGLKLSNRFTRVSNKISAAN